MKREAVPTDLEPAKETEAVDLTIPLRVVDIAPSAFELATKDVVPLPAEMVQAGQPLPMDLYLPRLQRQDKQVEMVRLLGAGRPPSRRLLKLVREAGLDTFYCHRTQLEQLIEFMGQHTARRLADHATPMPVKARLLYDQASLIAEQAMTDVRLGPNLEHGRHYVDTMADFIRSSPQALQDLADMLVMDYSLYTHSVNVCLLATSFAVFLGMEGNHVRDLGLSALYHDIGKRGIPEGILKKPGPLNDEEWQVMRDHPREGFELLKPHPTFPPEGLRAVFLHHENLDGSGYPFGLKAEQLQQNERIIRLVDVYDAITSVRVYKNAQNAFEGIHIMQDELKGKIAMDMLRGFVEFLGLLSPRPGRLGRPSRSARHQATDQGDLNQGGLKLHSPLRPA